MEATGGGSKGLLWLWEGPLGQTPCSEPLPHLLRLKTPPRLSIPRLMASGSFWPPCPSLLKLPTLARVGVAAPGVTQHGLLGLRAPGQRPKCTQRPPVSPWLAPGLSSWGADSQEQGFSGGDPRRQERGVERWQGGDALQDKPPLRAVGPRSPVRAVRAPTPPSSGGASGFPESEAGRTHFPWARVGSLFGGARRKGRGGPRACGRRGSRHLTRGWRGNALYPEASAVLSLPRGSAGRGPPATACAPGAQRTGWEPGSLALLA